MFKAKKKFKIFLLVTSLIVIILIAFSFIKLVPDTVEIINIPSEKFGDIQVSRIKNKSKSLSVLIFDDDQKDNLQKVKDKLLDMDSAVVELHLNSFLIPLKSNELNCYELVGELVRISEISANSLKLDFFSKPNIIALGSDSTILSSYTMHYAEDKFNMGASFNNEVSSTVSPTSKKPTFCMSVTEEVPNTREIVEDYKNLISKNFLLTTALDQLIETVLSNYDFYPHAPVKGTLPLIELLPNTIHGDTFVIFLSGDGGWASIDKEISSHLLDKGIPVIGFDSLSYFWKKKSEFILARDLEKVIKTYSKLYKLDRVILMGFSFGANTAPFAYNNMSKNIKDKITQMILLNPTKRTEFEIQFTDWLSSEETTGREIAPEIRRASETTKISCLYGNIETDTACIEDLPKVKIIGLKGNHHFDEDYELVSDEVLKLYSPTK